MGCSRVKGQQPRCAAWFGLDVPVGFNLYREWVSGLRISQLAEATGFPTATLRYYETIGLLAPARDANGYRRYDDGHVDRLRFVGRAKQLGLQLAQIAELLELRGDGSCPPVRSKLAALVTDKLAQTRHSIDEGTRFADELAALAARITGNDPPPTCGDGCGCLDHPLEVHTVDAEIACTLSAGDRSERVMDWRALAADAHRIEPTDTGWRLYLPDEADVVARAASLAAAERRCCAFLNFTLSLTGDGLVVDVQGPPEARESIADLFTPVAPVDTVVADG